MGTKGIVMDKKQKKVFMIGAAVLLGFGLLLGLISSHSQESAENGDQGLNAQQVYWYNQMNHRAVEYGNPGVTYNGN